ncbi:uncharacterized protein LOC143546215 [Bidens hawaiensis]|uniref:uncharacterized protein LOC143546215 n=1 Tax=Bidens hawaiensis TaxID=980011 RepID=UPI00404A9F2C
MDVEKRSASVDPSRKLHRRKLIIIWSSITGAILTIALLLLILGLTVYKPKKPILTLNSLHLQDLHVSLIPPVSFNLSLAVNITINNPNKVTIKYQSSSATLRYKNNDVGNVPFPDGRIGADGSEDLNLTLTVFADRLVSDSDIYGDVVAGNVPFSTYTRVKAKVRVLFFYIHVTSTSTCDVSVNVVSQTIANQTCYYKNKI